MQESQIDLVLGCVGLELKDVREFDKKLTKALQVLQANNVTANHNSRGAREHDYP